MTLTACRLQAKVGLRVMWTLMIIPFALNYHMLRVQPPASGDVNVHNVDTAM